MKKNRQTTPNTPEQILRFYKSKFPVLQDVELRDIDEERLKKYHGYALFNLDYKKSYCKGKTKQTVVKPYAILLNRKLEQNVYVLLH